MDLVLYLIMHDLFLNYNLQKNTAGKMLILHYATQKTNKPQTSNIYTFLQ